MTARSNRALALLRSRPALLLPALLAGLFCAAVAYVLETSGVSSWAFFGNLNARGTPAFDAYAASIVAIGWRIFGFSLGVALTTATAVRSLGAVSRITGVFILSMLLGAAAAALVVPTFGLSALAFGVFLLYAPAAAALRGLSAPDAIVDSIRTAVQNLWASVSAVLVAAVLAFAGQLVGGLFPASAQFSTGLSWVVMEAAAAYGALLTVAAYTLPAKEPNQGR